MEKIKNYTYHKFALISYDIFEKLKREDSKRFRGQPRFSTFKDFSRYIKSDILNNSNSNLMVHTINSLVMEVHGMYALPYNELCDMVAEFYVDDIWVEFTAIIPEYKVHFDV